MKKIQPKIDKKTNIVTKKEPSNKIKIDNKKEIQNKKEESLPSKKIHVILSVGYNKPNRVIALSNNNKKITNNKKEKNKTITNNYTTSKPINKKQIKKEEVKEEKPKVEEIQTQEENQTITYTVLSPTNEIIYNREITCKEPITVEQLLLNSGLEINNSKGFIESINGISNEGMSGWVFEVNNSPVMVSAADYIINPNEQITWKYIDFSKMNIEEQTEDKENKIVKKRINKEQVNTNK